MYYPVALNLEGRRVVVLGGDEEAVRKVEGLLACGAEVTVVSRRVLPSIEQWAEAGRIAWVQRDYCEGDLARAMLAIACDAAEGERARNEAIRRGVLLNVLDRAEMCDFIAVATFARDGLQFAVHSSGKSAALARRVRERLQRRFDRRYAELTALLGELRPAVRRLIPTADGRRRFWLGVVTEDLLDRVDRGVETEQLREEILTAADGFARSGGQETFDGDSSQPNGEMGLAHQENR